MTDRPAEPGAMPERVWLGFGHADASTHDGRDGSCTICPVPILHDYAPSDGGFEYVLASLYEQAVKALDEAVQERARILATYDSSYTPDFEEAVELLRACVVGECSLADVARAQAFLSRLSKGAAPR